MNSFFRILLFTLFLVATICSCDQVAEMKRQADDARATQDSIMTEFKKVQKHLDSLTADSLLK